MNKAMFLQEYEIKSHWKVILALDWVDRLGKDQKRVFDFIHELSKQIDLSVEPISLIMAQNQVEQQSSANLKNILIEEFRDRVKRSLNLAPPHVVNELKTLEIGSHCLSQAIDTLYREAVRKKADLIVTATHGRQGWQRLIHSSFVERLLLYSHIPVLSVGPQFKYPHTIQHILFPTDLSQKSRKVLRKIIPLTCALRARVTLFHSLPTPQDQETSHQIVSFHEVKPKLPAAWQSDLENHEEQAQTFVDAIISAGCKADVFLDSSGMDLIQGIKNYLDMTHVDMIATAAQSGPISNYFNGMTTRQLARTSSCPVLLLHQNPAASFPEDQTESPPSNQSSTEENPAA